MNICGYHGIIMEVKLENSRIYSIDMYEGRRVVNIR